MVAVVPERLEGRMPETQRKTEKLYCTVLVNWTVMYNTLGCHTILSDWMKSCFTIFELYFCIYLKKPSL